MKYCFDLDGTLCTNEWPNYSAAKPFSERIEIVNDLYYRGNTIVIDTARGCNSGTDWRQLTEKQLSDWGVKYHELRVGTKVAADIYVDDKAINEKDFFKK